MSATNARMRSEPALAAALGAAPAFRPPGHAPVNTRTERVASAIVELGKGSESEATVEWESTKKGN